MLTRDSRGCSLLFLSGAAASEQSVNEKETGTRHVFDGNIPTQPDSLTQNYLLGFYHSVGP